MNTSPVLNAVQNRLLGNGYTILPTPFKVAGVEFKFSSVMRGSGGRALDLVLLIDTTTGDFGERDGSSVTQRIEGLSRALDVTGSRYVVTAILGGATLVGGIVPLSEICRVLLVDRIELGDDGKPANKVAELKLDDSIRVLLPLNLPTITAKVIGEEMSAIEQLKRALAPETTDFTFDSVFEASRDSDHAVTHEMARLIDRALSSEVEEKQT